MQIFFEVHYKSTFNTIKCTFFVVISAPSVFSTLSEKGTKFVTGAVPFKRYALFVKDPYTGTLKVHTST